MTILLYDRIELAERASKHLKVWKAWHIVLYVAAAIFGIMNFVTLLSMMNLVDGNCVLFPRKLEFHWVNLPITQDYAQYAMNLTEPAQDKVLTIAPNNTAASEARNVKREATDNYNITNTVFHDDNGTAITENTTHRLMLHTSRTLFESGGDCEFAQFMPILSFIFACVWITFFTMCPGGGHARTGLQQPWRILTPALLFAIVMVALTGHCFAVTNKGLQAFCAAFSLVNNATTCSAVNPFLERSWNISWGVSERAASTRAASAAVLAVWAIIAALLLARCLTAPDFVVQRTGVHLTKDPQQKILPYIKKSRSKSQRSSNSSPTKRDTLSIRSEPTVTTELVTHTGPDSAPESIMNSPLRTTYKMDTPPKARSDEMDTPLRARGDEMDTPLRARGDEMDTPLRARGDGMDTPLRTRGEEMVSPFSARDDDMNMPLKQGSAIEMSSSPASNDNSAYDYEPQQERV